MKKTLLICATLLFGLFLVAQLATAQWKITGPWLWMVAPCENGQGGQASIDIDQLDKISKGKITEEKVAQNGAEAGDQVGNLKWVVGVIPASGGDNIQDMINEGKVWWGGNWAGLPADMNDYSAYSLITVVSAKTQNNITMKVGSDDSIKVWLNGEVVHKNAIDRGANDFQDTFEIDLKRGNNLLLVKVSELGGGWSMFAGIDAEFTAAGVEYRINQVPQKPLEPQKPQVQKPLAPQDPGDKITGPWLWMIAPCAAGQGGAECTDVDSLAKVSNKKVTEEKIAKNGAKEGDKVDKLKWTLGEIPPTGGDNVNDLLTRIGLGAGDINDHSAYAYINVISPKAVKGTSMFVGSDDSIKVWLNGKVVWANPVNRGASDYQDEFGVDLKRGSNPLLVKVSERGGGWSMFVGFAEDLKLKFNTEAGRYSVDTTDKLLETWGAIKRR